MHALMDAYRSIRDRDKNLDDAVQEAVEKILEGIDPEYRQETVDTAIRATDQLLYETTDNQDREFLQRTKRELKQVIVEVPVQNEPERKLETTEQMAERLLKEVFQS